MCKYILISTQFHAGREKRRRPCGGRRWNVERKVLVELFHQIPERLRAPAGRAQGPKCPTCTENTISRYYFTHSKIQVEPLTSTFRDCQCVFLNPSLWILYVVRKIWNVCLIVLLAAAEWVLFQKFSDCGVNFLKGGDFCKLSDFPPSHVFPRDARCPRHWHTWMHSDLCVINGWDKTCMPRFFIGTPSAVFCKTVSVVTLATTDCRRWNEVLQLHFWLCSTNTDEKTGVLGWWKLRSTDESKIWHAVEVIGQKHCDVWCGQMSGCRK